MQKTRLMTLVLAGLLCVPALMVYADGDDATPTPTAPSVGRRALTQGEDTTPQPVGDCEFEWFFQSPQLTTCPTTQATEGEMVIQRFEYGYMIWIQPEDTIYVIHSTAEQPRWQSLPDPYVAGMPQRDPAWAEPQPPQTSQPRLGFGALWREEDTIRGRVGWATQQWELVYDGRVQTAEDGTIYMEEPGGGLFALLPGAEDWKLYGGN